MTHDLTLTEQNHVRAALRYLQIRVGGWEPLSKALHFRNDTTRRVALGRNAVSASMTLRVARLAGVAVDDLLAGRGVPEGTCPHCGRVPDFADETTAVEKS